MKITKDNLQDVYRSKKASVETMELKGYELVDELFVDNSGFWNENEPAYTQSQFMEKLTSIVKENPLVYTFVTDCWQFQLYIWVFTKTGKKQCKKVANNTYEIPTKKGYIIRLHDTNILEYKGNKCVIDSGGRQTNTTKERINSFLPIDYRLFQKDRSRYIETKDGEIIDFADGMEISV